MEWDLNEAVEYYKTQGAPGDQSAVTALLREVQAENGGSIPKNLLGSVAAGLNVKETFLLAIIRRIPSLRLSDRHTLEICAGSNCGKHAALTAFAEGTRSEKITVRFVSCMRQCGKGPNIRWDGELYNKADEAFLRQLIKE